MELLFVSREQIQITLTKPRARQIFTVLSGNHLITAVIHSTFGHFIEPSKTSTRYRRMSGLIIFIKQSLLNPIYIGKSQLPHSKCNSAVNLRNLCKYSIFAILFYFPDQYKILATQRSQSICLKLQH